MALRLSESCRIGFADVFENDYIIEEYGYFLYVEKVGGKRDKYRLWLAVAFYGSGRFTFEKLPACSSTEEAVSSGKTSKVLLNSFSSIKAAYDFAMLWIQF